MQVPNVDALNDMLILSNSCCAIDMHLCNGMRSNVSVLQLGWIFDMDHDLIIDITVFELMPQVFFSVRARDHSLNWVE